MHRFSLDNGMRVVVEDGGPAEVAAVYLWINAGSAAEPAGLEGAAHFLEHMVFKGTASFGVGEVAAAVEDMGGDLNAFTAFDETVFHATVPAAAAVPAMRVLAEMMRSARLDPEELERERLVILEEIRGGQDDPDLVLGEATFAQAFPGHAYGRPIIGWERTVKAMTRDALAAYYAEHYQPANACLVVAGRVDAAEVEAAARTLFAGGGPARPGVPGTPTPRPGRKVLKRNFEATLIEIGWPIPGHLHPELPAIDVLCLALGGGVSSPIEARLRLREGLCLSATMHAEVEAEGGLALISLHAQEGCAEKAVRAAREEVARARAGGLDPREIERAKAQVLAQHVFGRETVDGRAHALAFDLERMGDPYAWKAYEAAVLAVTPAKVAEVARTWLAPEREVAVALQPPGEKVALVDGEVRVPTLPKRSAEVRRHVLDNGVRVLLEPDDGETVAVRIAGVGGALTESRAVAGRTGAWARAFARGTDDMDAVAFAAEVEALAGGISGSGSRSTQWVRGEFVARNFPAGLELLLGALLRPAFAEEELARVREEMLAALEEREDFPEQLLGEKLWALAYGPHPYGASPLGTEATIAKVTRGALLQVHRRWLRGENVVVSVTGGFDPERTLRRLGRALGGLPTGWRPPDVAPPVWPERTRRATVRSGREQAHVAAAWPGARVQGEEQPEVEILAALLGGQGGRLFTELREQHGLAYAVSAASQEGVQPGLLVCSLATDPARVDEAEERLLASVARLRDEAIPEAEVERVRRYLVGATEMELQTASTRASSLALAELYGLDGAQYRTLVRRRVGGVGIPALQARAARMLERPISVARVVPRTGPE